jgi:hypothetical protein
LNIVVEIVSRQKHKNLQEGREGRGRERQTPEGGSDLFRIRDVYDLYDLYFMTLSDPIISGRINDAAEDQKRIIRHTSLYRNKP